MYTITEALAELKTIEKRAQKKREMVRSFLTRMEGLKDPLEKQGGSPKLISQECQAISDLEKRHLGIRLAVQRSNQETMISISGITRSVAEWLTWRKEISPGQAQFVNQLRLAIQTARAQAQKNGSTLLSAGSAATQDTKPTDIIVNMDEAFLASEAEKLEEILGTLDGQLSLKNATTTIEI